jgi:DNA polymerase
MDETTLNLDVISRQLLARIRGLHGAGVDWLPKGAPLPVVESPPIVATSESLPADSSFDIVEQPQSEVALSLEERVAALQALAVEVQGCTRCAELCRSRTQTVFADGPPGAEVCFLGEAPGADEDASGTPFVGAAGQLLNRILAACGFRRDEVYICNVVKCRPPGNRTPLADEADNCRAFLVKQLELAAPKYIVALGGCAATNLLQTTLSIGKLRGRFHDYKGIPVVVTYHPAYLLPHKHPEKKGDVWNDMKMLLEKMGRPIPVRSG